MELSRLLKGKTVFIDTAPLIFFIERNPRYSAIVKPVVALIDSSQAKRAYLNDNAAGGIGTAITGGQQETGRCLLIYSAFFKKY